MRRLPVALVAACLLGALPAAHGGEEVSYTADGTTMKGYLARPAGVSGDRPAVLVVHEWWGHNDYVRRRADMLADLGYVALAVDMYGDGKVADHPEDAGKLAGEVRRNMDVGEKRFRAALDLVKGVPGVDAGRIAAIGYCFGGSVVIEMARRGLDLAGVVSFHGSLATQSPPAPPGQVKAAVLVLNGAADPFVKPEHIAALEQEMATAKADYRFVNYEGAVHSFTNPDATENGKKFNLPLAYDAETDRQSWEAMKALFDRVLR